MFDSEERISATRFTRFDASAPAILLGTYTSSLRQSELAFWWHPKHTPIAQHPAYCHFRSLGRFRDITKG